MRVVMAMPRLAVSAPASAAASILRPPAKSPTIRPLSAWMPAYPSGSSAGSSMSAAPMARSAAIMAAPAIALDMRAAFLRSRHSDAPGVLHQRYRNALEAAFAGDDDVTAAQMHKSSNEPAALRQHC